MQDMEFTIEDGKLFMLQTRNGKRTPEAAVRIAVDQRNEGLPVAKALINISAPEKLESLLLPVFDPESEKTAVKAGRLLSKKGVGCGGCATGKIVFTPEDAK